MSASLAAATLRAEAAMAVRQRLTPDVVQLAEQARAGMANGEPKDEALHDLADVVLGLDADTRQVTP